MAPAHDEEESGNADADAAPSCGDEGNEGDGGGGYEAGEYHEHDDWDARKAFVSRIPRTFDADAVRRLLEAKFGGEGEGEGEEGAETAAVVEDVALAYPRDDDDGEGGGAGNDDKKDDDNGAGKDRETAAAGGGHTRFDRGGGGGGEKSAPPRGDHRGFAFVTFTTPAARDAAVAARTVRGRATPNSKRKHTLHVRPVERDDAGDDGAAGDGAAGENGDEATSGGGGGGGRRNQCHLWALGRCPYNDACKFEHAGEGGCLPPKGEGGKKKQKCFAFKKKGKCKLGDKCPFSHEAGDSSGQVGSKKDTGETTDAKAAASNGGDKSEKDCLNWKNKGKCRKRGRGCPYRHLDSVQKKRKHAAGGQGGTVDADAKNKKAKEDKTRQPLHVRVFGLNYDTSEADVRDLFAHCGPIVEVTYPLFEDSGRSKGYCGLLFTSPKASAKACELDGSELHGRWLQVQAGRMYLKKWEEREKERREGGVDATGEGADNDIDKEGGGEAMMSEEGGKGGDDDDAQEGVGEFGQKVKKRKKHGHAGQ